MTLMFILVVQLILQSVELFVILVKGDYHLEVEGNYTQKIHKNFRRKVGAGEIGGNVEEEIFGSHAYNISGATRGVLVGEDVDIIVGGNETRTSKWNF